MKKKLIAFLLTFCMAVCMLPVLAGAASNWYDTYQDFLINRKYLTIKNPSWDFDPYWGDDAGFALRDLDNNGVPEILVDNESEFSAGWMSYVLGYSNGTVYWAGEAGNLGPASIIAKDPKYPGVFAENGRGGSGYCEYFTLKNGKVVSETVLESTFGDPDYQEWRVTKDVGLYNAYKNSAVLQDYTYAQIKSMGWDAFAAKYGFSKPAPVHTHSLKQFSAVAATCTKNGNTAYWMCSGCGKYFADATGNKETSLSAVTVKALGHSYKNGVCTRCGALAGLNDVFESDWFAKDVKYVVDKKLMNGTGNDMFSPNGKTTRGQAVTILYRLAGSPSVSGDGFSDVKSSDWFYKAVQWASKNGIASGYGNGKFGPNDTLNREQLATMLYRYAQFKKLNTSSTGGLSKFSDSGSVNGYALDAMSWAVSKGLISGNSDGKLTPGATATRAQLAAILHRFCENVK